VVGIIDAELLLGWSRFQRTDPDDFVVKCAVGAPRSEFASDDDPIRGLGLHGGHEKPWRQVAQRLEVWRCNVARPDAPNDGRNVPDWLLIQQ
jgi:hypothetical protein